MKITFYGGARLVTGANYLLDLGSAKLLVDCGLNQGTKYAEEMNYQDFKYDPKEIKFVFITHSHIDHIGRLPKLYKDGFRGKVYATTATRDLMEIALPDNMGHIEREAKDMGHEALFSKEDMKGILSQVEGLHYNQVVELVPPKDGQGAVRAILHDAGHILGSTIVEILWEENGVVKKIYFSGDLGNPPTPLLKPTVKVKDADYIVVESAYGDRVHEERTERRSKLTRIIKETINRGGVLMIPSFAVERTQELLFELNEMFKKKEIPEVPVFIDSPLAIKMTSVYKKHSEYFNKEAMYIIESGDDVFHFPNLKMTSSTDQSKQINDVPAPKIIIAGSGMSQGGRILHHERRYLSDPKSTILFVGYQVDGSLGRRIQRGEKVVKIFGDSISVNCEIETVSSYSAHADQPALLKWISASTKEEGGEGNLKKVFVVQGEEEAAKTLANLVHDRYGVDTVAPVEDESFEL
ncbi:MAG: MBL fold metallo-hydrolase RNA specificity domain-containing protein [Candidatus Paceibacterota bacterium]